MKKHIRIAADIPSTGALDFSHLLDAPAGCHGQTVVRDGSLYFEDGTRARFVGFNLSQEATVPLKPTAEAYAARLASMGCNVVRLTAGDSEHSWSRPGLNYSTIDYGPEGKGRKLNLEAMDRMHYFVAELKKRGIYVQVDLHVARTFTNLGDLEHTPPQRAAKAITIFNRQLISMQKEFATAYLSAVNPYTGLSFLDDPVVMGIQITNENSAFWCNLEELREPLRAPFETERKSRFNEFLLKKYGSRQALAQAWTRNGECGLQPHEDPALGTVEPIEYGDYTQPYRDHRKYWAGPESPARYADYMEYGMELNRYYYEEMAAHLRGLGAAAPINGCNLLHGIADIYSSTRSVDLLENNAYYNHPMGGRRDGLGVRYTWHENVKTDPRKATYPDFAIRDNHLLLQLAGAAVKGKPYIVNEWNEYGGMPFHSTAYLMQAAYACLQDWDGLMIYSFSHQADCLELKDDTIDNVFNVYNDPSLIGQFGALATIFLRHDVATAQRTIDMCYTMEDCKMLPENYKMPFGFLPFVSKTRTVFLEDGTYAGDADVAVSSGFASNGDYTAAEHAVVYARSPYADAMQQEYVGGAWLDGHRAGGRPYSNLGTLSNRSAVVDLDKIDGMERNADYTAFSRFADGAMKAWGLVDADKGLAELNRFVSDTGEISFDFGRGRFAVDAPRAAVFSGYPNGEPVVLGPVTVRLNNERMTLSLLPRDGRELRDSRHMVLLATGDGGNDANQWAGDISLGFGGKLFVDDPEGTLTLSHDAYVFALDVVGNRLYRLQGERKEDGFTFALGSGQEAALAYEICLE